jgi:signal peptide peptidase SppA
MNLHYNKFVSKHFILFVALISALAGALIVALVFFIGSYSQSSPVGMLASPNGYESTCNVLGLKVHGQIVGSRADIPPSEVFVMQDYSGGSYFASPNYTVADELVEWLRNAYFDNTIKAIFVDIKSGGGMAVAGEALAAAIRNVNKPSIAVIHDLGASSAYLTASAADTIFASRSSSVGSIGVTSSFTSQAEKNQKEGIAFEQLSSGPFKDTFNPDKELTDAERDLIMRDVLISRDHFVQQVSDYRSIPFADVDKIADGSTVLGMKALELGLIDEIGGTWDALETLENRLGEPVSVCWL